MALRALPIVACLVLAGCASPAPDSGIQGTVWLGPTCPVETDPPDPECADRPYQTSLVVVTAADMQQVAEFESAADGTFKVTMRAGKYLIRSPADADGMPSCASRGPIGVIPGNYTEVDVYCDSGIR